MTSSKANTNSKALLLTLSSVRPPATSGTTVISHEFKDGSPNHDQNTEKNGKMNARECVCQFGQSTDGTDTENYGRDVNHNKKVEGR